MLALIWFVTVIIIKEQLLVTANGQCSEYQLAIPFFPGESCEDIFNKNPQTHDLPGYYWILMISGPLRVFCGMNYTGSSCENIYINNPETRVKSGYYRINNSHWTYCNMTAIAANGDFITTCAGVGGGWRRIANIDISAGDNCPSGWTKDTYSDNSFCRKSFDGSGCSSATFTTSGITYQKVCGKARGYQKGHPNGGGAFNSLTLDGYYANGLSITYGSPQQHIWTYANGDYDSISIGSSCPCDNFGSALLIPSFVGNNYYCESGREDTDIHAAYHFDDPLWDRSGCIDSNCCSVPNQPLFYRQLSGSTSDDIEVRLCDKRTFANGFTLIDQLELYIQ